jgi:hypothetical protein
MHEAADGEMGHHQAIEFLPNKVGRLASLGFAEGVSIFRLVGNVQRAAIEADQAPMPIPGTLGGLRGDGLDDLVVELTQRLPSQPDSSLGDAGPHRHLRFHGLAP